MESRRSMLWDIARLMWSPQSLPETALNTSWVYAGLLGEIGYGVGIGALFTYFGIAVYEPWGYWQSMLDDIGRALLFCMLGPLILFFGAAFSLSFFSHAQRSGAVLRVILLSPYCFLLPYLIWLVCFAVHDLEDDVVYSGRFGEIVGSPIFAILTSCEWLPLFVLCWQANMVGSIVRVRRMYNLQHHLCHHCGYDLRGSIPAGATDCPECGHAIAPETIAHFNASPAQSAIPAPHRESQT